MMGERKNTLIIVENFNQPHHNHIPHHHHMPHPSPSRGSGDTNYRRPPNELEEQKREKVHNQAMAIINRNNAEWANRLKQQREDRARKSEEQSRLHESWDRARKEQKLHLREEGKRFDKYKKDSVSNREQIKKADETNDLIERRRVREDIIGKNRRAENFSENFAKKIKDWNESPCWKNCNKFNRNNGNWDQRKVQQEAKKYRDNRHDIEKDLPDIERDLLIESDRIEREMAPNDRDIKQADESNDLYKRRQVRNDIIQKSARAADYLERFADLLENWNKRGKHHDNWDAKTYRKLARKYRNYQHQIEKDLPAIEEDIKNKKTEEKQSQDNNNHRQEENKRQEENERNRQEQEKRNQETKDREDKERKKQEEEQRKPKNEKNAESEKDNNNNQGGNEGYENDGIKNSKSDESANEEHESSQNIRFESFEVDEQQVSQGLETMDAMCNGLMAPDLEAFDNFFDTLLGKEVIGSNPQTSSGLNNNMFGDYVATSYSYRDAKMSVSMNIRQLFKVGGDSTLSFDQWGTDILNLSGVNVVTTTGKITFALNGFEGQVIFSSDLSSLQNYLDQRAIEGAIYLTSESHSEGPIVDPEKLPIWGLDNVVVSHARVFYR